MGDAVIQLYFWRKHLPSDRIYIGLFNGYHVPSLHHLGIEAAERECRAVVDEWNRDGSNTDWVYAYIGVRNQEVADWEKENA